MRYSMEMSTKTRKRERNENTMGNSNLVDNDDNDVALQRNLPLVYNTRNWARSQFKRSVCTETANKCTIHVDEEKKLIK